MLAFHQYLRTTQIPKLEFYVDQNRKLFYRWANCIKGFNLPLVLKSDMASLKIFPAEEWKSMQLKEGQAALFTKEAIEKMYYISAVITENKIAVQ